MSNSNSPATAVERQKSIYLGGIAGKRPVIPVDSQTLQLRAKNKLSPEAFAYIAGGAGKESTIVDNHDAFQRWQIVPRMLRDVSQRDTSVELFGRKFVSPLLLCPIGVLDLVHAQADLAVARAAASENTPMIFSNQASIPMERCAEAMGDSPRWFQLYWSKSNDLVASLVQRAESCGCGAIVITLDTTLLGWRVRDLDLAYLPFLQGRGIAQYTSDPVFLDQLQNLPDEAPGAGKRTVNYNSLRSLYRMTRNFPGGFFANLKSGLPMKAVRHFIATYSRPSLTWQELDFVRQHTSLPILLKGILHPDDAQRALDAGIDGIIVSNHGGRQVDGAISSLQALPKIVKVIQNKIPVLMDSGIRCGADIFKAISLGASAVCLGRPYVYGLALGGEHGVREVIRNIKADFELTMALAGCTKISDIDRRAVSAK